MKRQREKQTVYRNATPRKFTTVPNATLRDRTITVEARGLLCFALSHPPDWQFRMPWLISETGLGRDRAYKRINELISAGYCKRVETRNNRGKIDGYECLFTDTPGLFEKAPTTGSGPLPENPDAVKPLPDLPDTAQPLTENQDAYKRTIERTKKYRGAPSAAEVLISDFESEGDSVLALLFEKFGKAVFDAWFSNMLFERCGLHVKALVPSPRPRSSLQQRFGTAIQECCAAVWPGVRRVDFVSSKSSRATAAPSSAAGSKELPIALGRKSTNSSSNNKFQCPEKQTPHNSPRACV